MKRWPIHPTKSVPLLLLLPFLLGISGELYDKLEEAERLYREGSHLEAKDLYEEVIQENRNIPEVWHNLGNVYSRLWANRVIADALGRTEVGDATEELRASVEEAMKALPEGIDREAVNPDAVLSLIGKPGSPERDLRNALDAYEHLSIERSGDPDLISDAAYNAAQCRTILGIRNMATGDIPEATRSFEAAVDGYLDYLLEHPEDKEARRNIEAAQELNSEAHRMYLAALSHTPTPTPTVTPTPSISPTPMDTPTGTRTPPTPTPSPSPGGSPSPTPGGTQTPQGDGTPSPQPTGGNQPTPGENGEEQNQEEQEPQEDFMDPEEAEAFLDNLDQEIMIEIRKRRPDVEKDW